MASEKNKNQQEAQSLSPKAALEIFVNRFRNIYLGHEEESYEILKRCVASTVGVKEECKPIGSYLTFGPSGSGKSYFWECISEAVHGKKKSILYINGGEYQHSHEVARLVGSPPGYLGHRETEPMLGLKTIEEARGSSATPINFILVDEIDKSSSAVQNIFLSAIERSEVRLGSNVATKFDNCLIAFTANAGESMYKDSFIGYDSSGGMSEVDPRDGLLKDLSGPFLGRMDGIWLFKSYTDDQRMKAIKMQVQRTLDSFSQWRSGIVVDDTFYEQANKIKESKNFGMRDLIRRIKSVVRERCEDIAVQATTNKVITGADLIKYLQRSGHRESLGVLR